MGSISLQTPVLGQPASTEDPKVISNFGVIQTAINGGLDSTNLSGTANIAGSQLAAAANIAGSQLAAAAGVKATQTDGTTYGAMTQPTRLVASTYTPNASRPVYVKAVASWNGTGLVFATLLVGTGTPSVTVDTVQNNKSTSGSTFMSVSGWVPAGQSYLVNATASAFLALTVTEWVF